MLKGCKIGAVEKTYVDPSGVVFKHSEAPLITTNLMYKNAFSSSVAHRNNAARDVAPRSERKRATWPIADGHKTTN